MEHVVSLWLSPAVFSTPSRCSPAGGAVRRGLLTGSGWASIPAGLQTEEMSRRIKDTGNKGEKERES